MNFQGLLKQFDSQAPPVAFQPEPRVVAYDTMILGMHRRMLESLLRELPYSMNVETGPAITGGAIRRWMTMDLSPEADVDVIFPNDDVFSKANGALQRLGWNVESSNKLAVTWRTPGGVKLQHLSTVYGIPRYVIGTHDMTCCAAVADGSTIIAHPEWREHCEKRRIVYLHPRSIPSTVIHTAHYAKMGFHLSCEEAERLISMVTEENKHLVAHFNSGI